MATKVRHPIFARFYARVSHVAERDYGQYRARLLDGLKGEVVEVGAGNGLNFRHYPQTVTRVVAVEPEPHLRHLAIEAAARATVNVEVVDATAEVIPAPDAAFDAAVTSLVLCSVPDQAAALAEIHRVLRPGGELRFFEHVQAQSSGMARAQRALDATVWPFFSGGCHTGRDTGAALTAAGFEVAAIDDIQVPESGKISLPTSRHILGTAIRA